MARQSPGWSMSPTNSIENENDRNADQGTGHTAVS